MFFTNFFNVYKIKFSKQNLKIFYKIYSISILKYLAFLFKIFEYIFFHMKIYDLSNIFGIFFLH